LAGNVDQIGLMTGFTTLGDTTGGGGVEAGGLLAACALGMNERNTKTTKAAADDFCLNVFTKGGSVVGGFCQK